MAKYHVNPQTGQPGLCRAAKACPFGGEADHYSTKAEAQAVYESKLSEEFGSGVETFLPLGEDEVQTALGEMHRLAYSEGVKFGGSNARTTDVSEGGAQALVIALARGESIEQVMNSEGLAQVIARLPKTVENREELLRLGAKLQHELSETSKIEEIRVIARASYDALRKQGFTNREIADSVRWMGREVTQGADGTAGDIGINLPDGRYSHISLKSESTVLHNGTTGTLGQILDEENYDPFEAPNVRHHDAVAFRAAGRYLAKSIEESPDGVSWEYEDKGQTERWTIRKEGNQEYLVYEKKGQEFSVPTSTLKSLAKWKELTGTQQKVLGSFVTANMRQLDAIPAYGNATAARARAINENLSGIVNEKTQADKKKVVAKFMGLRNTSATYVNHSQGQLHTASIPTISSFLADERTRVGSPIVSKSGAATILPVFNEESKTVSFIEVRTRFGDRQFNYSQVKVKSSYLPTRNSAREYLADPDVAGYSFSIPMENIFSEL